MTARTVTDTVRAMVDRLYSDADMAHWYDVQCPWTPRGDFDFYLPWLLAATSVLDVGCGTGTLLKGVRDRGHSGRLIGLDPAEAMLDRARRRSDVEWVLGDLGTVGWRGEFELAVMTGHAFQVFRTDDDIRAALVAVHAALIPGGRFAFETRNPAARAWERWTPEHATDDTDDNGVTARCEHRVESVRDQLVTFTETFTVPGRDPMTSRSTLRFADVERLDGLIADAGFDVEHRFGDWDGGPLSATSPEIITIARRDA